MWLKTRGGYALNLDHVVKFDRTNESGTYYLRAVFADTTSLDLPGAYSSESDAQEALAKLTKSFDASVLVP